MILIYRNIYDFIKDEKRNVKQPPKLSSLKITKKILQFYNFHFLSYIFRCCNISNLASLSSPTNLQHRFYWH